MRVLSLTLLLAASANAFQFKENPVEVGDTMERLQPVLDKLRNLDPKSFGALSSMMDQAQSQTTGKAVKASSFIQFAKESPDQVADKMAELAPILDKLQHLDGKAFGALSGMMNQVKPSSFIQFWKDDPSAVADKLAALGPVLDKLRNLDPKSFGAISGLMNQMQGQDVKKTSLIQVGNEPDPTPQQVQSTMDRLGPILDKLQHLDPKSFGALSGVMNQVAKGTSLIQRNEPDPTPEQVATTVDRLGPVLDKLRNLDPKAFGAMSDMLGKAQQQNQK